MERKTPHILPNVFLAMHTMADRLRFNEIFQISQNQKPVKQNRHKKIDLAADDLLVFSCVRNEMSRLPFFLEHYRSKGADKFFFIDNASSDGTAKYLMSQGDVFLFQADGSYAGGGFGANWIEILLKKYGVGRWCLLVDADELFIYPHFEVMSIKQLCLFLEREGKNSAGALMLDIYAKGFPALEQNIGRHIWEVFPYFDRYDKNPHYHRKAFFGNVAIMCGGVRKRVFGADVCLGKTPLIKYSKNHRLAASAHCITNINPSLLVECALFHFKFDSHFPEKVREEASRGEHWSNAKEYRQYARAFDICPGLNLYNPKHSMRYENSRQLVDAGLMKSSRDYEMYALGKSTRS
jgi:Glycosyl transferase family 2